MVNLARKVGTFIFGTYEENARNNLEGELWTIITPIELLGGMITLGESGEYNSPTLAYLGGALALDGLFRLGNIFYKFAIKKPTDSDLNHSTIPQAGLIGTIRQTLRYVKER